MRWHWRRAGASTGDALALALAMRWLWRWRCTGTAGGQLDQPAPQSLFASHPSRGLSPASRPKSETGGPCVARPKHHCSYWPFAPLKKLLLRPNDTADRQSLETGQFPPPPFSARQPIWETPPLQSPLMVAPFSAVCPFHKTAAMSRARASPPCSPGPFASLRAAACARPLDIAAVLLSSCFL